jgi:membrane-bound lytic murein transglycosylase MltF
MSAMRWSGAIIAIGGAVVVAANTGPAHPADAVTPPTAAAPSTSAGPTPPPPPGNVAAAPPRQLTLARKPWKGDFDQMVERRLIRVLVPYSRTLYYTDKGRERGITAELVREWERYIGKKYAKQLGRRPVTVVIIPTTRDKLIPGVVAGLGDIAAGNITATDLRSRIVDFVAPVGLKGVSEIVVTGPAAPAIRAVEDLAGIAVHVRPTTSYHESLALLNDRFRREGKPPATLRPLPDALEDEDKLEMVNAGLLDVVIVDDWIAKIWSQILPNIKLIPEAAVRTEGRPEWVIRKHSPKLAAEVTDFYTNSVRKRGLISYLQAQALKRVEQIRDNRGDAELKRFQDMIALLRKYGEKYNFDPLMLAAQGYQESGLNQKAKSRAGAIGVMQIMPATGAQLKVGDIRLTEPNIHAGAKYMDQLMTRHFLDAKFTEGNRPLFAFASYNAGPTNISRMRRIAEERGLDPNQWFNNVEIVTAEKIGIETTTYVRNIYKYYIAYRLTLEQMEQRQEMKDHLW